MHDGENGSGITFRIFDWRTIGFPFLFPDLAALRARIASEASVWKKWPGSVDRDIVFTIPPYPSINRRKTREDCLYFGVSLAVGVSPLCCDNFARR